MDHTTLETLMRCEAEAVFRHVRHLTAPTEPLATFFGRVVHEGVRAFYEAEKEGNGGRGGATQHGQDAAQHAVEEVSATKPVHSHTCNGLSLPGVPVTSAEAGLGSETMRHAESRPDNPLRGASPADVAAQAALVYWADEVASGRVVLPDPALARKPDHRTSQLAAALVRLYAAAYPTATRGYDVVMNEQYLELGDKNEASGRLPIGSSSAHSRMDGHATIPSLGMERTQKVESGIVDRMVRRHADGLLYVLDLKTSSWAPNRGYWRQWSNSQQAAIYLDLVEAALGESPAGFWLDHIYVSGRKDGPKPGDFTQFGPVAYSAEKRRELGLEREMWCEKFERLRVGTPGNNPDWPKQSTRSCFRFNSACPYLGYCAADPADREDMIQRDLALGQLVVRPWDPKERDV